MGGKVIHTPPCLFPWRFSIENIQGCMKMTSPPTATPAAGPTPPEGAGRGGPPEAQGCHHRGSRRQGGLPLAARPRAGPPRHRRAFLWGGSWQGPPRPGPAAGRCRARSPGPRPARTTSPARPGLCWPRPRRPPSRGRWPRSHAARYISFAILHAQCTGCCENDLTAPRLRPPGSRAAPPAAPAPAPRSPCALQPRHYNNAQAVQGSAVALPHPGGPGSSRCLR